MDRRQIERLIYALEHLKTAIGYSFGPKQERRLVSERRKDPFIRRAGQDPRCGKFRRVADYLKATK